MQIMVTMTGISHFIDCKELEANQDVILKKEPTNKYDKEAIAVYVNDSMQVGYIANSTFTVAKGTSSAGRLYDKIGNEAKARILVIFKDAAVLVIQKDGEDFHDY